MINSVALRTRPTSSIMGQVMLALVPGTVVTSYTLGSGVLINITVLVLVSLACESVALVVQKRQIIPALSDGSIVLAAWLLALCLPPSLPITQLIFGAMVMTVLGKHVYGGLGQNPFNPAMVGYAVLLISFPKTMTLWFDPDSLAHLSANGIKALPEWWKMKWHPLPLNTQWDSITQATPLDKLRTLERQFQTKITSQTSINDAINFQTYPWLAISVAWTIGGLYLLFRGIIRWHIPVAMLTAAALSHWVIGLISNDYSLPVWSALLYGGLLFGAFFVATDPVTAPSSQRARLYYGAGIGILTVVLRTNSNYPEGVAFAVLLMNSTTPLLDRVFVLDKRP